MAITCACFLILVIRSPSSLIMTFDHISALLWIRALNNTIDLILIFWGIQYLELSEYVSIIHWRPFPIALLCYVLLKEPFSYVQTLACRECQSCHCELHTNGFQSSPSSGSSWSSSRLSFLARLFEKAKAAIHLMNTRKMRGCAY